VTYERAQAFILRLTRRPIWAPFAQRLHVVTSVVSAVSCLLSPTGESVTQDPHTTHSRSGSLQPLPWPVPLAAGGWAELHVSLTHTVLPYSRTDRGSRIFYLGILLCAYPVRIGMCCAYIPIPSRYKL